MSVNHIDSLLPAERVTQLESHLLDENFSKIIDEYIDNLSLPKFSLELKLLIRYLAWRPMLSNETTIGKSVYSVQYVEKDLTGDTQFRKPRFYKLQILTISNLVLPYILRKLSNSPSYSQTSFFEKLKLPWLSVENTMIFLRLMKLVNFLLFLKDGRQLLIPERLLGLIPAVPHQKTFDNVLMNRYQMEVIFRDTVWQAISDLVTCIIPHLNIVKIKNQILLFLRSGGSFETEMKLSDSIMRSKSSNKCGICNKQPFNPYIIGCKHVFCYYCIHAKHLNDPTDGFVCQPCNFRARDQTLVTRYRSVV